MRQTGPLHFAGHDLTFVAEGRGKSRRLVADLPEECSLTLSHPCSLPTWAARLHFPGGSIGTMDCSSQQVALDTLERDVGIAMTHLRRVAGNGMAR